MKAFWRLARAWGLGMVTWKDSGLHHTVKTLWLTVLTVLAIGAALVFPLLARAGRPFVVAGCLVWVLALGFVNYAFHYRMKDGA